MTTHNLEQFYGLIYWSYRRNKVLLTLCSIVQLSLTFSLTYGYSLIIPDNSLKTHYYLASGAISMAIISIGCTITAQNINHDKQNGLVTYMRTLPVPRHYIVLSELLIWTTASLPGIVVSFLLIFIKFNLTPQLSLATIIILLLSFITMISLGFAIAYWTEPNVIVLVTQLILMIGLLFSPITYPAERLPEIINMIYRFFPFVAIGDLIRNSVFLGAPMNPFQLMLLLFWSTLLLFLAVKKLNQRD